MKIVSIQTLPEEGVSHDPELRKKVMIHNGELPHLKSFAQLRMAPGQIAHAHSHAEYYEVFLIQAGEGTVTVDTAQYHAATGTCVVFEPGEIHELANTGSEELVLSYFSLEALSSSR